MRLLYILRLDDPTNNQWLPCTHAIYTQWLFLRLEFPISILNNLNKFKNDFRMFQRLISKMQFLTKFPAFASHVAEVVSNYTTPYSSRNEGPIHMSRRKRSGSELKVWEECLMGSKSVQESRDRQDGYIRLADSEEVGAFKPAWL